MLRVKKVSLVWLMLLLMAMTSANESQGAEDEVCIPVGQVLLPASGKYTKVTTLINTLSSQQVVLLGEHHDNIEHHRWQLQTIAGLHVLQPKLVLGFEMFARGVQTVLDRWVAGELSEEDFLKEVNWAESWRFDASLYLPLFHYARMNQIPMVALNVQRALITEVGEKGWDNVPVEMREGVTKPEPASQGYRELLANVFMHHDANHHDDKSAEKKLLDEILKDSGFNRFVNSQSTWDRAMAEAISNGLKRYDGALMLAVVGSGHMMHGFGIPEQLEALGVSAPKILIPWDPEFECSTIDETFADAVIGLKAFRFSEETEHKARLGVYLETSDKGVLITKIMEDSVAESSEIKVNDIITNLAGQAISEIGEVVKIVQAMQPGTFLPISILRDGQLIEIVAKFPVLETE